MATVCHLYRVSHKGTFQGVHENLRGSLDKFLATRTLKTINEFNPSLNAAYIDWTGYDDSRRNFAQLAYLDGKAIDFPCIVQENGARQTKVSPVPPSKSLVSTAGFKFLWDMIVYPTELENFYKAMKTLSRISIPLDDRHVLIFNPGSEAESQQRLVFSDSSDEANNDSVMLIRPKRSGEKCDVEESERHVADIMFDVWTRREFEKEYGTTSDDPAVSHYLTIMYGRETFVVAGLLPTYRYIRLIVSDIRHGDHFDVKYYSFDPQVLFDRLV